MPNDKKIIESWKKNHRAWISAIQRNQIQSRVKITNAAIIDTILSRTPETVLDIGCGEGWLVRKLEDNNIQTTGIDIVPELIRSAKLTGKGMFRVLPYESICFDTIQSRYDVIVCNFSLLGFESVNHIFEQVPALLNKNGTFIIQTLHPVITCEKEKYQDGWRQGSWDGFSQDFCDPPPWYFRTLETWQKLFVENGLKLESTYEPMNSVTQLPASVIFMGIVEDFDR